MSSRQVGIIRAATTQSAKRQMWTELQNFSSQVSKNFNFQHSAMAIWRYFHELVRSKETCFLITFAFVGLCTFSVKNDCSIFLSDEKCSVSSSVQTLGKIFTQSELVLRSHTSRMLRCKCKKVFQKRFYRFCSFYDQLFIYLFFFLQYFGFGQF